MQEIAVPAASTSSSLPRRATRQSFLTASTTGAPPPQQHVRSQSEPPPSVLFLKQSLVRLDGVQVIAEQESLSLSTKAGETSVIMVDGEGNLRDELGFLLLLDTNNTPSSAANMVESPKTPFLNATPVLSAQTPNTLSLNQRKAWEDFFSTGDTVHGMTNAELHRWQKLEMPTAVSDQSIISSIPAAAQQRRSLTSKLFGRKPPQQPPPASPTSQQPMARASFRLPHRKRTLTTLIRQYGVPTELRAEVWFACSGAEEMQRCALPEQQYDHIIADLDQHSTSSSAIQIEKDLTRTFPTNYLYQKDEGIASLRQVLLAYSVRNPQVGYCQSMNFIVGTLLLHMTECEAFWILAAIVENLAPGYFGAQLLGVHLDQRVFAALLKNRFPKVVAHIEHVGYPLSTIVYQWFLCLFVNKLPLGTTLRIWDSFLHEGPKVLFRVGLTIIRTLSKDILSCEDVGEMNDLFTSGLHDRTKFSGHMLMRGAFDPIFFSRFSSEMLAELRQKQVEVVWRELGLNERHQPAGPAAAAAEEERQASPAHSTNTEATFAWEFSPRPASASLVMDVTSSRTLSATTRRAHSQSSASAHKPDDDDDDDDDDEESVVEHDDDNDERSSAGTLWSDGAEEEESTPPRTSSSNDHKEEEEEEAVPTVELPSEYLTRLPGLKFVLSAQPSSLQPPPVSNKLLTQVPDEEMEQLSGIFSSFGGDAANDIVSSRLVEVGDNKREEPPAAATAQPVLRRQRKRRWSLFASCI